MKNHEYVNGKLLQTNKTYSHLKMKQKEKISNWMYEETLAYYNNYQYMPTDKDYFMIIDKVYTNIEEADIWIPYDEIVNKYQKCKNKIFKRIENQINNG